jgi:hypothetical protein
MGERVHVVPQWEQHEESPDCWCEPLVSEEGMLVVHYALRCLHGQAHAYRDGECRRCGAKERGGLRWRE